MFKYVLFFFCFWWVWDEVEIHENARQRVVEISEIKLYSFISMFVFDCWWTCRKASTKVLGLELPLLCNAYIRQFYIPQYSTQVFPGNTDRDTVVYHDLNPVIDARFVRVLPMEWFDFIGMRMELYSCQSKLVALFIPGWIIVLNFQKWSTWIFSL